MPPTKKPARTEVQTGFGEKVPPLTKAGSGLQGVGRRSVLVVHQRRAPRVSTFGTQPPRFRPSLKQVLGGKALGGDAYWTYVSLPGTQPPRFCDFL